MAWEIDFLNWLQGMRNPVLDKVMVVLSTLGNAGIFWICVAIILIIIPKTRKIGLEAGIAMLITFIIGNLILKNAFDRTRPWVIADFSNFPAGLKLPKDASFPSGHTMNGVTCALSLMFNDKRFGIPALILALAIAFSRMYNYCHFPTDIIGGIFIGILSSVIVHIIFRYYLRKMTNKTV